MKQLLQRLGLPLAALKVPDEPLDVQPPIKLTVCLQAQMLPYIVSLKLLSYRELVDLRGRSSPPLEYSYSCITVTLFLRILWKGHRHLLAGCDGRISAIVVNFAFRSLLLRGEFFLLGRGDFPWLASQRCLFKLERRLSHGRKCVKLLLLPLLVFQGGLGLLLSASASVIQN